MVKYLFVVFFLSVVSVLHAQQREWEQYLYQLGEIEDFESSEWENSYDMLCDLEKDPININTASREELEQLPFLTSKDVENIAEYIYRYGAVKSLGELAMISDLDYFKRRLLSYFTLSLIHISEPTRPY